MWIGIGAIPAAAGPGMPAAMDEPLLHHNLPGLVPSHRAGMCMGRGMPSFRALDVLTFLGRPHDVCSVRGMDDVVGIAVEDDGANARAVVCCYSGWVETSGERGGVVIVQTGNRLSVTVTSRRGSGRLSLSRN